MCERCWLERLPALTPAAKECREYRSDEPVLTRADRMPDGVRRAAGLLHRSRRGGVPDGPGRMHGLAYRPRRRPAHGLADYPAREAHQRLHALASVVLAGALPTVRLPTRPARPAKVGLRTTAATHRLCDVFRMCAVHLSRSPSAPARRTKGNRVARAQPVLTTRLGRTTIQAKAPARSAHPLGQDDRLATSERPAGAP
jgi:hypothetical protein